MCSNEQRQCGDTRSAKCALSILSTLSVSSLPMFKDAKSYNIFPFHFFISHRWWNPFHLMFNDNLLFENPIVVFSSEVHPIIFQLWPINSFTWGIFLQWSFHIWRHCYYLFSFGRFIHFTPVCSPCCVSCSFYLYNDIQWSTQLWLNSIGPTQCLAVLWPIHSFHSTVSPRQVFTASVSWSFHNDTLLVQYSVSCTVLHCSLTNSFCSLFCVSPAQVFSPSVSCSFHLFSRRHGLLVRRAARSVIHFCAKRFFKSNKRLFILNLPANSFFSFWGCFHQVSLHLLFFSSFLVVGTIVFL